MLATLAYRDAAAHGSGSKTGAQGAAVITARVSQARRTQPHRGSMGAWPSVFTVAGAVAFASWAVADRRSLR
ncbi:hypothetical protein [Streptomyces sp. NPDC004721]